MIAIAFSFAANRFHATQWGRHVNEGAVEWPPSPWRILRALVAAWQRTLPEMPPERVVPVLEALAQESPRFHLPPASTGHTRHYMPQRSEGDRTLIIDSFVSVSQEQPVVALWPGATLSREQTESLSQLLANLAYLGRAESWCTATLVDAPPEPNCHPLVEASVPAGDWETTRVLVPESPLRLKHLCVETAELRRSKRIDPPGARWQQYVRPIDCLRGVDRESPTGRHVSGTRPTVFRYALAGTVVPLITDTLRLAELARRAAMAHYGRATGGEASPILSGKDADGAPLAGHRHAFYLPTDEDEDGYLDHLNVWAPAGFGEAELRALARVSTLNAGAGRAPVTLAFLGCGHPQDFEDSVPVFRKALVWRTVTPFVMNRHVKLRGIGEKRVVDGPLDQVWREIKRRPQIDSRLDRVEYAPPLTLRRWRKVYPLEFHRWRPGKPQGGSAFNACIHFSEPAAGPIALGFGCHYGLGLFMPLPLEGG